MEAWRQCPEIFFEIWTLKSAYFCALQNGEQIDFAKEWAMTTSTFQLHGGEIASCHCVRSPCRHQHNYQYIIIIVSSKEWLANDTAVPYNQTTYSVHFCAIDDDSTGTNDNYYDIQRRRAAATEWLDPVSSTTTSITHSYSPDSIYCEKWWLMTRPHQADRVAVTAATSQPTPINGKLRYFLANLS